MPLQTTKPFLGYVGLKKTAGSGPMTLNSVMWIPAASARPRNPKNNSYDPVINKAAYATNWKPGKKTPSVVISATAKGSWFLDTLINSLILSWDANNNSDEFAVILYDASNTRYYTHSRCAQVRMVTQATSGIGVEMTFLSQYGDSDDGSPPTFTPPTGPSAGQQIDVSQIDTGASPTADGVRSMSLNLMRAQQYVFYLDGTKNPDHVCSGMFGGSLTLSQTPLYTVSPSTSATVRMGSTGAGMVFSLLLNNDEDALDIDTSFGTKVRQYTFVDTASGGNPCTIAAYP